MICELPSGFGTRHFISVEIAGRQSDANTENAAIYFAYDSPKLLRIEPPVVSAEIGSVITIFGRNFGNGASGEPDILVRLGQSSELSVPCNNTELLELVGNGEEQIRCTPGERLHVGQQPFVRVEVAAQDVELNYGKSCLGYRPLNDKTALLSAICPRGTFNKSNGAECEHCTICNPNIMRCGGGSTLPQPQTGYFIAESKSSSDPQHLRTPRRIS